MVCSWDYGEKKRDEEKCTGNGESIGWDRERGQAKKSEGPPPHTRVRLEWEEKGRMGNTGEARHQINALCSLGEFRPSEKGKGKLKKEVARAVKIKSACQGSRRLGRNEG